MRKADVLSLTLRTIRSNKLRSAITISIIALGITALVGIITAIQAMYFKDGTATVGNVGAGFKLTLIAVAAVTIILGVYPNLLLYWLYF